MNQDTGEIIQVPQGQPLPARFIPLTAGEANKLKGFAAKNRMAELKRMRKTAIRAAKKKLGRRLNTNEVIEALSVVS